MMACITVCSPNVAHTGIPGWISAANEVKRGYLPRTMCRYI